MRDFSFIRGRDDSGAGYIPVLTESRGEGTNFKSTGAMGFDPCDYFRWKFITLIGTESMQKSSVERFRARSRTNSPLFRQFTHENSVFKIFIQIPKHTSITQTTESAVDSNSFRSHIFKNYGGLWMRNCFNPLRLPMDVNGNRLRCLLRP